jgi:phospholipase C
MSRNRRYRRKPLVGILALATIVSTWGAATAASPAAGAAAPVGIAKINHIVVMMQENRSYDSYFARLHYEGQPASEVEPLGGNPNPTGGARIHPFLKTALCETSDLNHSWNGTHQEWNGGLMNGFTAANVDTTSPHPDPSGSRTMGYYSSGALPFYYGIANQFAIADRYFASTLTQTFPNRFYLYTGTSFGHIRNDIPSHTGFTQPSVFGELTAAHVSWRLYVSTFSVAQLLSDVINNPSHVKPISQYYTDAANGALPQVSFVESNPFGKVNVESDEHPNANVQVGEKLVHDVMQALVQSPNWPGSAMFLTYDEHGGFYDHVAPPAAVKPDNIAPMLQAGDVAGAFDRYGIRVPAMVISPYAKEHFVSHTVYDHTSILHFIETRFGLATLTHRDAAADPMLGMFDFTTVSHAHPLLPSAPVYASGVSACSALHP